MVTSFGRVDVVRMALLICHEDHLDSLPLLPPSEMGGCGNNGIKFNLASPHSTAHMDAAAGLGCSGASAGLSKPKRDVLSVMQLR